MMRVREKERIGTIEDLSRATKEEQSLALGNEDCIHLQVDYQARLATSHTRLTPQHFGDTTREDGTRRMISGFASFRITRCGFDDGFEVDKHLTRKRQQMFSLLRFTIDQEDPLDPLLSVSRRNGDQILRTFDIIVIPVGC